MRKEAVLLLRYATGAELPDGVVPLLVPAAGGDDVVAAVPVVTGPTVVVPVAPVTVGAVLAAAVPVVTGETVTAPVVAVPVDAVLGVAVPVDAVPDVTGVMTTPVTLPVICAFCLALFVPRAARVALAFASFAASAATESGARGFLGATANAARVVMSLLNISSTVSLIAFTFAPLADMAAASASLALASPVFAVDTAELVSRSELTNVTAWGAVNVSLATVKIAFGQYLGMPPTSATYSAMDSLFRSLMLGIGTSKHERGASRRAKRHASSSWAPQ
jgi:hypothetical protein